MVSCGAIFELLQKLHLLINARQFMASQFIALPFDLSNLGSVKRKELQKIKYLENKKSFLDEIKSIFKSF